MAENRETTLEAAAETTDVTGLLQAWGDGDRHALDRMLPLVYDELRRLARRHLRGEAAGHTLQATALTHEAFCRLVDLRRVRWRDRRHFFAMASRLMRRILVDHARRQRAAKRGGPRRPLSLDQAAELSAEPHPELLALDAALEELETLDPRQSRIVEMRFFGGFKIDEVSEVLGVSPATVRRDWTVAKAWLRRELHRRGGAEG